MNKFDEQSYDFIASDSEQALLCVLFFHKSPAQGSLKKRYIK
jgi:hypothetical protein